MTPLRSVHCIALLAVLAQGASTQGQAGGTHTGPPVAAAEAPEGAAAGPARFVAPLYGGFDMARAMADSVFIDGFYRTPASPLYDRCLDRLAATLGDAGYGRTEGLVLRWIESEEPQEAWWPTSALLELTPKDGASEILLAFASPGDTHRTMLPVGALPGTAEGPIALATKDMAPGSILVTRAPLSTQLVTRARARGAGAVLSASSFGFTLDPEAGGERHKDAILFRKAPRGVELPVGQISLRAMERIEAAEAEGGATLRFVSRTRTAKRTLRTLVAEVVGASAPGETVVIASHLQEPGAGDNATGTAGLAASASALARAMAAGTLPRPARSVTFVFGNEMQQSKIWMDEGSRRAVAALSADMLGQSQRATGSVALLERAPDPGAIHTIPPDKHTPWGAGRVSADELSPSGINVICRAAFIDVAAHVGGWTTSENPWEGGSDHDVFLRKGTPAALMWHFTDFTYHTSLDRMDMIDLEELRRTCTAIVSAALDMADPTAAGIERHLASNELERTFRVELARGAGIDEAVQGWERWCDGAARWLRASAPR